MNQERNISFEEEKSLPVKYKGKKIGSYRPDFIIEDKVILEIVKVLKDNIREADLAIRYGGEEFVVMLHNANEQGTQDVAKKIHSAFANLIFDVGAGETMQKTMSIGIAMFPEDGDTIWKCIKFADTALYVAKTTGRNKIVKYTKDMSEGDNVR